MNRILAAAFLFVSLSSFASAQHRDIFPFVSDGQVAIGEYDYDVDEIRDRSVFIGQFDSFYAVNDPGFTAFSGPSALPGSTDLEWDFVPLHSGAVTSTLLYWDGIGAPDFGAAPTPDYELSIFGKNAPVAATTGDQIITGDVIDTTGINGTIHEHRFFFLDDNGDGANNTLPDQGIYLISLRFRAGTLDHSDPIVMVWGTPEAGAVSAVPIAETWANDNFESLVGIAPDLPGDFNSDGVVDAADYTVWRDGLGVDFVAADYDTWVGNFGASAAGQSQSQGASIPEPAAGVLLLCSTGFAILRRKRA